ncbi:hypothetical protein CQA66_08405 [Helicobacter aurati]|uniref:DNA adenine methylase n=1 Tax=Helicobacter aurati TaxID=137778 RepID=A0A3D8IZN6_9HELI|nr:DNA adenine methylase [Helicobacter aurati]RDU70420.1 hypothetical protein CQA66_08405 [Helicobacter aurati]
MLSRKLEKINVGMPYLGSKRKICFKLFQRINELAPNAKYFYDLFGGGGCMSILAAHNGYKVTYNELNTDCFFFKISHE